jgi:hypothetical protein
MLKVDILYPQPNTTLYGNELKFRYKLLNNLEKYKTDKIVLSINGEVEIESATNGSYIFSNLNNGDYEIVGYLKNKNNVKIENTEFSVKFNVINQKYESKNLTWAFAKTKLPQFIQDDYSTFTRFVEAYYEWLHKSNNPVYMPFASEFFADIDTSPEVFLSNFRIQYLNDFPDNLFKLGDQKNLRTLVKNIKQFYRAKGTEKSFRFLMRLLFNSYVDFYYPKKDLMKASGNLWVENVGMKIKNIDVSNAFLLKNAIIYQKPNTTITASARVLRVNAEKELNQTIVELFVANVIGTFNDTLPVYCDVINNGVKQTLKMDLLTVISSVNITSRALKVNDKIYLKPGNETGSETGSSFFAVVQEVDLLGNVKRFNIINSGYNYTGFHELYKKNKDGTFTKITGSYQTGVLTRYPGYYKTISSSPSSRGKLQDNRIYQELSYVLQTELNVVNYADLFKRLVHPAGVGLFGSYLIKRDEQLSLEDKTEINLYYSGFIGNFLPYTFNTIKNLRNDNYPNGNPITYPTGLKDLYPLGFDPTQTLPNEITAEFEHIPLPYQQLKNGVTTLNFTFIPNVSDSSNINTYWVVFPHPNILLNTSDTMKDIKIRDFLTIKIDDLTTNS